MTESIDITEPVESFQVTPEAAEMYEAAFVPAFFTQWASILCEEAGISSGMHVLDVACGTGVVARVAADQVGPFGVVTGIDLNAAMLTVARRVRPDIDYRLGDAAALPVPDASYDVVVSQMALMFFPDQSKSLREMARVAKPGGTVAVLVPSDLGSQAVFGPFVAMAARHAGAAASSLLTSYFRCGDLHELSTTFEAAGLVPASSHNVQGTYRAPSVDAFVTTEVESTPLRARISDQTYQAIRADACDVLAPFTASDGSVQGPFETNLVVGRKPVQAVAP
ncbi:MAG TPA: methyltransferase domain-containing protein [Microlunatus sp.]